MSSDTIITYRSLPRESGMERTIREGVERLGGYVWSVRDSRQLAVEHMPDLIIVLPKPEGTDGVVALLELKSQKREVTTGQRHVLDLLAGCNRLVTGVVRPVPNEGEMSLNDALELIGVETA